MSKSMLNLEYYNFILTTSSVSSSFKRAAFFVFIFVSCQQAAFHRSSRQQRSLCCYTKHTTMLWSRFFGATAPVEAPAPVAAPPPTTPQVTAAVGLPLRSIAEAHVERDKLMDSNGAGIDMCCLPVGPYDTEEEIIETVRVWASAPETNSGGTNGGGSPETNGGGFGIFKESQKPAGKAKGPRRLLRCDRSGKVKPSKSNKPIQLIATKKCDCDWGVWIKLCKEGWTTVELPKKARDHLRRHDATMATVHNHTLLQSAAEVSTNARKNYADIPPAKKQRTSSVPMSVPAATPSSCRSVIPIYAPPSHEQIQMPPYYNVPRYTLPMPMPAVTPSSWGAFPPACTPPWFPVGYRSTFQRPQPHHQYLGAPSFPVINPILPACASFGFRPACQLMEIFGFTPFGIYCRICKNDHVGSSKQRIKLHLESKGHGLFSKDALLTFEATAGKEIEQLLMSKRANLDEFLVGSTEGCLPV